jgi:Holliday junction resolvase RusA-like endonuclease
MENGRIRFEIYGKPIAQARPKFFTRKSKGGKVYAGAYSPQATEAGRFGMDIRSQLPAGWEPIEGPVAISVFFGMPVPASASRKKRQAMLGGAIRPDKKPDLDNLIKFVKDCLTKIVWRDDS